MIEKTLCVISERRIFMRALTQFINITAFLVTAGFSELNLPPRTLASTVRTWLISFRFRRLAACHL